MPSTNQSIRRSTQSPDIVRLGTVDYLSTWNRQRQMADERATGSRPDAILLLEHPATYTAGKRTEDQDRPHDDTPVVDVDRGGRITWHGPGQLVGYPIIALQDPIDVIDYVRRIESALIASCAHFGVTATRVEGRSGVWCEAAGQRPERKIAAIGIRVQKGVTMHGFALNCDCDLSAYQKIVPCGIVDAGVTSLTEELERTVTVDDVTDVVAANVVAALDGELAES